MEELGSGEPRTTEQHGGIERGSNSTKKEREEKTMEKGQKNSSSFIYLCVASCHFHICHMHHVYSL